MIRAFGAHCHKPTPAPQQNVERGCKDLLDNLVGAGEQRGAGPSGQRLRATDDGLRHRPMCPLTLDGLDAAMRELVR
jgi:hypothetical protein